jgi:hypothetical protein
MYPHISQHIQDERSRLDKVKLLGLAKFKESYLSSTHHEVSVFQQQVEASLKLERERVQKETIDRAVGEATATAAPAPRGLFGGMFV